VLSFLDAFFLEVAHSWCVKISLPVYFGLRWRQSCTSATPTDITTDEKVLNLKSASDSQSGKPEPLYGTIKESP